MAYTGTGADKTMGERLKEAIPGTEEHRIAQGVSGRQRLLCDGARQSSQHVGRKVRACKNTINGFKAARKIFTDGCCTAAGGTGGQGMMSHVPGG